MNAVLAKCFKVRVSERMGSYDARDSVRPSSTWNRLGTLDEVAIVLAELRVVPTLDEVSIVLAVQSSAKIVMSGNHVDHVCLV